jgi:hypothetical protein
MAASKPQSKDDQVTEYIAVGKFSKNVVAAVSYNLYYHIMAVMGIDLL